MRAVGDAAAIQFMPFRFCSVDDAALQCRRDAHDRIQFIVLNQPVPRLLQIFFILGNDGKAVGILHAIAEEKQSIDIMTVAQQGPGKLQRGMSSLRGVGGAVYDYCKFHALHEHRE